MPRAVCSLSVSRRSLAYEFTDLGRSSTCATSVSRTWRKGGSRCWVPKDTILRTCFLLTTAVSHTLDTPDTAVATSILSTPQKEPRVRRTRLSPTLGLVVLSCGFERKWYRLVGSSEPHPFGFKGCGFRSGPTHATATWYALTQRLNFGL